MPVAFFSVCKKFISQDFSQDALNDIGLFDDIVLEMFFTPVRVVAYAKYYVLNLKCWL